MNKLKKTNQFFKILVLIMLIIEVYLLNGCIRTKEEIAPVIPLRGTAEEVFPICTEPSGHYDPEICGNFIVQEDECNGNWDIYGFKLSEGEEFFKNYKNVDTFPYYLKLRFILFFPA